MRIATGQINLKPKIFPAVSIFRLETNHSYTSRQQGNCLYQVSVHHR
jgi:hypothetical protein